MSCSTAREVIAVVQLINKLTGDGQFTKEDEQMVSMVCDQVAVTIQNCRDFDNAEEEHAAELAQLQQLRTELDCEVDAKSAQVCTPALRCSVWLFMTDFAEP